MFKVPSSSQNTSFMKPPTCYYHTARLLAAQGFNGVDQTYSITSNGGGGGDSNTTENTMRFHKTRMCSFHQKGACIKGSDCTYAHDPGELKSIPDLLKTRLCQDWLNGRCTSKRCKFAHGRNELRFTHDFYKTKICHFWQQGACTKGCECRHAHGEHELRPLPSDDIERKNSSSSDDDEESTDGLMVPRPSQTPMNARQAQVMKALRLAEEARKLAQKSAELLDARENSTTSSSPSIQENTRRVTAVDPEKVFACGKHFQRRRILNNLEGKKMTTNMTANMDCSSSPSLSHKMAPTPSHLTHSTIVNASCSSPSHSVNNRVLLSSPNCDGMFLERISLSSDFDCKNRSIRTSLNKSQSQQDQYLSTPKSLADLWEKRESPRLSFLSGCTTNDSASTPTYELDCLAETLTSLLLGGDGDMESLVMSPSKEVQTDYYLPITEQRNLQPF